MKYCPIIDGNLYAGIWAVGQLGVWRLVNSEFDESDASVLRQMSELELPFQPELEKFVVTEISKGKL